MKWILLIVWASNGNGVVAQEFDSHKACTAAATWVKQMRGHTSTVYAACMNKETGEIK